jgi:DNA-binding NarL/FixJ family response regulator
MGLKGGDREENRLIVIHVLSQNFILVESVRRALSLSCLFRVVACDKEVCFKPNDTRTSIVYLLDHGSPRLISIRRAATLAAQVPKARKIVVGELNLEQMCQYLSVGVHGFLKYREMERKLRGAIDLTLNGHLYVSRQLLEQYAFRSCSSKHSGDTHPHRLTPRQTRILDLLKSRSTNKEISSALQISENTVKFHLKKIFAKLGVHDRYAVLDFFGDSHSIRSTTPESYAPAMGQTKEELQTFL